jgi:hypothetical protein
MARNEGLCRVEAGRACADQTSPPAGVALSHSCISLAGLKCGTTFSAPARPFQFSDVGRHGVSEPYG